MNAPNHEIRTEEESDLYLNIVTFGQPFIEEDGSRVGYIYNGKKYYSPDLI